MNLSRTSVALAALLLLGVSAAAGQDGAGTVIWTSSAPTSLVQMGTLGDVRLSEASGAAASHGNPGIIWTLGDSGNPPEILAIDSLGNLVASFRIAARNIDWEAISIGPCGTQTCVYIADTGDNRQRRESVVIHRVTEPDLATASGKAPLEPSSLEFRYPAGSHDVEAMGVTPAGDILLVSKGRNDVIAAYRLAGEAWQQSAAGVAIATELGRLPIEASLGQGKAVTDLAIHPDGTRLVIRTYRELFLFDLDTDDRPTVAGRGRSCTVLGAEPQGEGITWWSDDRLLLISERGLFKRGTIHLADCGFGD